MKNEELIKKLSEHPMDKEIILLDVWGNLYHISNVKDSNIGIILVQNGNWVQNETVK